MASDGKNLGGRAYLVAQLKKRGLSRRRSLRVLNFIFEEIRRALAQGEEVEFAGGKLKQARKSFGEKWDTCDDWPANRQPYTVEWAPSGKTLKRLLGSEEAAEMASEFCTDDNFAREHLAEMTAERRRVKKSSRRKAGSSRASI